jgi:hypothetical protein
VKLLSVASKYLRSWTFYGAIRAFFVKQWVSIYFCYCFVSRIELSLEQILRTINNRASASDLDADTSIISLNCSKKPRQEPTSLHIMIKWTDTPLRGRFVFQSLSVFTTNTSFRFINITYKKINRIETPKRTYWRRDISSYSKSRDLLVTIWSVATSILNKQSWTADNGWSSTLRFGRGGIKSPRKMNLRLYRKCT